MNNPYLHYGSYYPNTIMSYSRKIPEIVRENPKYPNFLTPGDQAPNFTLEGIINGQPKEVSLSNYRGKWVILFFYSSDFSFV